MPEATPTTAPAATPSVAAAVPAAAPQQPTANAAVTPIPAAAAEPAPAAAVSSTVQPAKAPAVIASLIGDDAPADGAKPAEPAKAAETPAEPGAVVYDLKLPEGLEADPALLDGAKAIFTEGKVAPELAQKLTTFHAEQMQALGKAMLDKQIDAWNGYISAKQAEVMADPVIGGAKFPEAKTRIESGLKTFFGITDATPVNDPARKAHAEFLGVLKYTGAGSTLPMLRLLDKIASPRSEGRPAPAGQPSVPKTSPAEKFYGKRAAAE